MAVGPTHIVRLRDDGLTHWDVVVGTGADPPVVGTGQPDTSNANLFSALSMKDQDVLEPSGAVCLFFSVRTTVEWGGRELCGVFCLANISIEIRTRGNVLLSVVRGPVYYVLV